MTASLLRKGLAAVGLLGPAFRLRERLRARMGPPPPRLGPDGLPLPDRLLMVRVVGHADWQAFYESGQAHAAVFAQVAASVGRPLSGAGALLDWGCGCGRITRHLPRHTTARIFGRDPDALTVGWCARELPGDFRTCGLHPPLDLGDASVDAVISLSVFTHLAEGTQREWLAELARVIAPGGLLLLTFMDEQHHMAGHLGSARADLDARGFAVTTSALEGTNHMATFQTLANVVAAASPWFDAAASRTSRETSLEQAIVALVRGEAGGGIDGGAVGG